MTPDETDRSLLALLQVDNQRTLRDLADAVGISAPTCLRRLRRLREKRVIRADVTLLDPASLGYGIRAYVEVTLHNSSGPALKSFETRMAKHAGVLECCEISGQVDYLLLVVARDLAAFSTFCNEVLGSDRNVAGFRTHMVLRTSKQTHAIPL